MEDNEWDEFFGPDQWYRMLLAILGLLWIVVVLSFVTG